MSTSAANTVFPSARNPGIDALRGVSILLVILNHLGIRLPLAKSALAGILPVSLLKQLNYNGYEAVFIFFVISGFLITGRSLQRWGSMTGIVPAEFYVRRAARILPCLLALVAVLSAFHLLGVPQYVIDRPGQTLPAAIASALGLYLNWYEGSTGYLPGGWDILWSLSIEEVFYLAFPLLCLCLRRSWLLVFALASFALTMPFTHAAVQGNEIWQEKAYLPGMSAIAVGILAALLARHVPRVDKWQSLALMLVGVVGIGLILFAGSWVWHLIGEAYLLMLTISAAILLLGLHWRGQGPASRRWRAFAWLESFGRWSYEIYLTHMFCVFAVVGLASMSGTSAEWSFVWYIPAIGSAWLLGYAVARWFSDPCEKFLRRRYRASRGGTGDASVAADHA